MFDTVYDLTKFFHPGGDWLIIETQGFFLSFPSLFNNLGRDVDRFVYGGYSLEKINSNVHDHSKNAFILLKEYEIGKVIFNGPNLFELQ